MEDPRIRKLARFLISRAVYLQKGEKILIELHGREIGLARALTEEAYAAGGRPFVHIFDYDLERALLCGAGREHMKAVAAYELARMKDMDAYIDIRAAENINAWKGIPESCMDAYRKEYWQPIHLDQRCNHTKWSVIRFPNNAMAQLGGMSTEDYEDFYFRACLLDYDKMARAMEKIIARMNKTDMVRITGPGTDIAFSIKGIPSFGMSGNRNIPDGEIYTSPVRDSVNGIIQYNVPSPYEGFVFTGVRFEFRDGKIVQASSNNTEKLNHILDTDPGARYIGEFALGVNPVIRNPIGDILFDEKISGSFHLTPGQAYENADNGNKSAVHWDLISIQRSDFGGGELYFDGELIRKDGVFVPPDLQCLNPEHLLQENI
jgi:aminopeptidase